MEMQKLIEIKWPAQHFTTTWWQRWDEKLGFSISQTVFFQHTVILILSMTELGPKSKDAKCSDL